MLTRELMYFISNTNFWTNYFKFNFNLTRDTAAHQQKLEFDIINFFDLIKVKKSLKLLFLK